MKIKSLILFQILFLSPFLFSQDNVKSSKHQFKIIKIQHNEGNCIPLSDLKPENKISYDLDAGTDPVSFRWPFSYSLGNGLLIWNYADNHSGSTIKDYMGNDWSYNGHNGTDISVHSFREMDKGMQILAAAKGVVTEIRFSENDRNYTCSGLNNYILIRHDDNSYAYYYHIMKKSALIKAGEYVQEGDPIAYIGSSGCSSHPHLHFEPGYFYNGSWNKRDPFHGTYNTYPTMWQSQNDYVGDDNMEIYDAGIYTAGSLGGNINSIDIFDLQDKIWQPNYISYSEPAIGVWMHYQSNNSNTLKIELRKPNGTLYDVTPEYSIYDQSQGHWTYVTFDFNPGSGNSGTWYARILVNDTEQKRVFFNVSSSNVFRPRFTPAGKFYRKVSTFYQNDELSVNKFGSSAAVTYTLSGAPSNVSLEGNTVSISPEFNQTYRLRSFRVIAQLGSDVTLRDTMNYWLVDTTKNPFGGNGIVSMNLTVMPEGLWNSGDFTRDTVNVYLRNPLIPYLLTDSAKVALNSNGIGIANFLNTSGGIYHYIVVKHRNSIETWSKNAQLLNSGNPEFYNFTSSASQAYGNNMKYKNFRYCIYSGDVNQDGVVDATDFSRVDNEVSFFLSGYVPEDINGDRFVDADDMAIVDNNSYSFVSRVRP